MKQVININFHGQVVPIEVSAFDLLKRYTDSLSRYFAMEEGKEEIINDIESRIAELFQERLKKGATCITDDDVNAIIESMGRPEDFDTAEGDNTASASKESAGQEKSQQKQDTTATPKRLYRDENNKVLGGVCSGLANYFGIDPAVMRIIFVVVSLAFGTGILAYIIMWASIPSSASTEIGGTRKKLFRDPDEKIVAGVCSGIGNYFGVSAWIPRVFFLLPFLSFAFRWHDWGFMDFPNFLRLGFSPGSLIIYIIFWLVLPEANTTAEKLEMKGEKVDLNSIKNSVMEEMKEVQQRAEKFGKEAKSVAAEKGKAFSAEAAGVARRSSRSLGDVIVLIVKAFAYFIIGCVGFALVLALFSLAIVSIGVFPLKDFLITDGWQNAFAWGTLIFFIAVPVIGIITWIIRRVAKIKTNRKLLRGSFISMWILGWACMISLISSVGRDFRAGNTLIEEEVSLSNPTVERLEITTNLPNNKYYEGRFLKLEPFEDLEEDTVYVRNIEVKVLQSANDSFRVTTTKFVRGRYKKYADTLASVMQFNAVQKDSLLVMDKGIGITRQDKFRNQHVLVTVYVPVGKKIKVNRNVGWGYNVRVDGPWNDREFEYDDNNYDETHISQGVEYIMKADGLYTLDGRSIKDKSDSRGNKVHIGPDGIEVNDDGKRITINGNGVHVEDNGSGYRYDNSAPVNKIDSMKQKLEQEQLRLKDSLEKVKEKIERQLDKIDGNRDGAGFDNRYPLQLFSPIGTI